MYFPIFNPVLFSDNLSFPERVLRCGCVVCLSDSKSQFILGKKQIHAIDMV